MTGRHVISDGRMLAVAARSHVHGDPLAPGEDLHGRCWQTQLDRGAGEAVGDAIELPLSLDVIDDANAARAPCGEDIRLDWQGVESRAVEFFEQLPARAAEPADRPLLVDPFEQ